ncbi:fluoride efflux transporter CrcB [bacterium LRH843]|nr:fluoride efflux transporter CrcB [bacterium LRH843]
MNILAVGLGGSIGAILRYVMGLWIPVASGFPVATLSNNLVGCFFLAWFFTITAKHWRISQHVKLAVGTGVIGAFTTFSTFSIEALNLIENEQFFLAMGYVFVSVFGGIGLSMGGAKVALLMIRGGIR